MHEIITLQLGRQSNYVAAHFWNAQESYFTYGQEDPSPIDHDIHWRAGIGADGTETYLPRTVIYDRKGGFGSLRKVNALYEVQQEEEQTNGKNGFHAPTSSAAGGVATLWSAGRTVVQRADPILPSAYTQSLDAGVAPAEPLTPAAVRYWSDYSRVYYHPRSLIEVGDEPEAQDPTGNSRREYTWQEGEALFAELDREHDLLDRDLRPFVEEADQMQGFQVLASADDAWGGFAARYLERVRDEYGKASAWLWALQEPAGRLPREKRVVRLANKARTLAAAYEQASLVIPLAVPATLPRSTLQPAFEPGSTWHAAALLATALETTTLPARLRPAAGAGHDSLAYLTELLNATGKQTVANLQMAVGQPWKDVQKEQKARRQAAGLSDDEEDSRNGASNSNAMDRDLQLDVDFAPQDEPAVPGRLTRGRRTKTRMFGQAVVTRDSKQNEEEDNADADDEDGGGGDRRQGGPTVDRRDIARRRFALKPVSQRYSVPLGFPLLDSFPYIYRRTTRNQSAVPVTTALATDSGVSARLQSLRDIVASPRGGIGLEDRETLGNELAGMADAYHDGWSSGSDEGDDE